MQQAQPNGGGGSREQRQLEGERQVQHTRTPPYHPASNGTAERLVQTDKRSFIRQLRDEQNTGVTRTMQHRVDQFLLTYRNTPCSTTEACGLLSNPTWRTRLPFRHNATAIPHRRRTGLHQSNGFRQLTEPA
ncbi:uncharacterized protein LOC144161830 [Haemaphysalis longicornis]